jgi:hypothetical protein
MGAEARCRLSADGRVTEGKALLETEELVFRPARRGGTRLVVRFADIRSVRAAEGRLLVEHAGGSAAFDIGTVAPKWLEKIKNPRSRLDKLGVKPGQRVAVVGSLDEDFLAELRARAEIGSGAGRDVIFLAAERRAELDRLPALKARLVPNGAVWVVRPKGQRSITETDVLSAGRAAGLVDVKVVAFSATHTAEKLVIPVSKR